MWPFKKKQEEGLNFPESVLEAMKILEKQKIKIKTIEIPKELAKKIVGGREAINEAYQKDPLLLLGMNTEFACFLHKKQIPEKLLKTKPKKTTGMIFGIDIVCDENEQK